MVVGSICHVIYEVLTGRTRTNAILPSTNFLPTFVALASCFIWIPRQYHGSAKAKTRVPTYCRVGHLFADPRPSTSTKQDLSLEDAGLECLSIDSESAYRAEIGDGAIVRRNSRFREVVSSERGGRGQEDRCGGGQWGVLSQGAAP